MRNILPCIRYQDLLHLTSTAVVSWDDAGASQAVIGSLGQLVLGPWYMLGYGTLLTG